MIDVSEYFPFLYLDGNNNNKNDKSNHKNCHLWCTDAELNASHILLFLPHNIPQLANVELLQKPSHL